MSVESKHLCSRQFNCCILSFVSCNFPLVFKLSQSRCSLLVHFLLQVLSLHSVFFVHLLQDIKLMCLASKGLLSSSCFVFCILLGNCSFHLCSLIILEPVGFALFLLLQKNIFLARLIHILQQIDTSLIFSLPLGIPHFVLSVRLFCNFFVNCLFESCLIVRVLFIVLLQFQDLSSSLSLFSFFKIDQSLFFDEISLKELFISLLLSIELDLAKLSFSLVMIY